MPKIRLLIVDDSATVRAILGQIVEQDRDCVVIGVAATIPAAREIIATARPNLITLDLNLPGINGLDFLDEMMGQQHAPIVVLSSSTVRNSDACQQALKRGAYACFDKNKILIEASKFRRLLHKTVGDRVRQQTILKMNIGGTKCE